MRMKILKHWNLYEISVSFAHALEKMENLWGIHVTQEIIKQIVRKCGIQMKMGKSTEKKDVVAKSLKVFFQMDYFEISARWTKRK